VTIAFAANAKYFSRNLAIIELVRSIVPSDWLA
jgi:hypothetical protein